MWCNNCNIETNDSICPLCGAQTIEDLPVEIYWCDHCHTPIIQTASQADKGTCPLCKGIKMARDNRNASDDDAKLLSSEPYPLVMDAPLSAFDKRRIKTVCEALPNTAEQVIIFIKDTDGELAEEYMGDKIGCRHYFDKKNEFETVLV